MIGIKKTPFLKSKKLVNQHLYGFQRKFSENQKVAIMASLMIIANADGEYHRKQSQFLNKIARALGYKFSYDRIKEYLKEGPEQVFHKLNSLSIGQKTGI